MLPTFYELLQPSCFSPQGSCVDYSLADCCVLTKRLKRVFVKSKYL
ncbi:hypothetical protein NIES2104_28180 [Leptolyngbya sp. NIES-2104]|nr:hypothetical protein NIES2104_28180 [Leptolyngbya sp. NIES-2104]